MISLLFFWLLALLLLLTELVPALISLYKPKYKKENSFLPVSIIIPTRNEEKIIEKVIKTWLDIDYPQEKEIIFCDHSSDGTPEIIKKWAAKYHFIKYLKTDTGSKLGNILLGAKTAKYSLIVLNDADKFPGKDSLRKIIPFLTDGIGAVFGKTIPQSTKGIFQTITSFELLQKYIDQKFYSNIDSVPYLSLCNCIIRKKDISEILPQKLIADDVYLAVKIRENNFKCLFVPEAEGFEEFAGGIKDLVDKRFRVSQGTSQIALSGYLGTTFNNKLGKFGTIVVPLRQLYFIGTNIFLLLFLAALVVEKAFSVITWPLFAGFLLKLYFVVFFIYFIRTLVLDEVVKYRNNKFFLITILYPVYYLIFFRLISSLSLLYYIFKRGFIKTYWR